MPFTDLPQSRPMGQPARRARSFRDRIDHDLGMKATGHDHRAYGEEHRPAARAAPQHQSVPAWRPLVRKQHLAHARMDAVCADQYIPTRGLDMRAGAIEEMRGHAALVLRESAEPATGVDGIPAQPLLDGAMNHALQAAA